MKEPLTSYLLPTTGTPSIRVVRNLAVVIAPVALCVQTAFGLPTYKLEEICAFPPGATSESGPWAALAAGPDNAFYGTTYGGGSNGYGSVFRVTTNGTLTTLISFANTNGANPRSALLLGPDGVFYGTTAYGGNSNGGTAFRLTTNGDLTTLAHFDWTNGAGPVAALIFGPDGALYGTTAGGGSGGVNFGTIYRLTTNGALTSLVTFDGTNGYFSDAPLLLANDGVFYGTTIFGGPSASPSGYGNVFRITPDGNFTSIATFAYTNGVNPSGNMVQGSDGGLYGTTVGGGGKVYRVTTNGVLNLVVAFDPFTNPPQGTQPWGGLVRGSDGAYFGTASSGGAYNKGTVFRVTTNGLLITLASFTGTNGANPRATLVQGDDGAFYGTARKEGSLGGGNVFRLVVFSRMLSVDRVGYAWNVTFSGVEGETYRLLRSTNLSGPWSTLTNMTLGPDRTGQYFDTDPPDTSVFYRTVTP